MNFSHTVLMLVKKVPKGKVVSYGQVAAAAGSPGAARVVGGVLRGMTGEDYRDIPWWRVINNQGVLSIKGNWTATKEMQQDLLTKEGVLVSKDFIVDMQKYRAKDF
jgi:methylated-DNA-protein-cysteine methyltransferase related protein